MQNVVEVPFLSSLAFHLPHTNTGYITFIVRTTSSNLFSDLLSMS